MCLAEYIAGATGAANMGDILNNADISTYGAESSIVKEVETATDGMGKAGNGNSREENE